MDGARKDLIELGNPDPENKFFLIPVGQSSVTASRKEGPGDEKTKKMAKFGVGMWIMPSKFTKKYCILYTFYRGNGTESAENHHTM